MMASVKGDHHSSFDKRDNLLYYDLEHKSALNCFHMDRDCEIMVLYKLVK